MGGRAAPTPEPLAYAGATRHRLLTHELLSLQMNRMTALLELGEESGRALVLELGGDASEPRLAADPGQALALTKDCMRLITARETWIWATRIASARVAVPTAVGPRTRAERVVKAFARGLGGLDAAVARAAPEECQAIRAEARDDTESATPA
ncbi:hypothetical protein FNH09_19565 [Streptomyces adustus]|uniref:Uncharacterized protein n=1 Tax=Streptomyces adustus TaxID=1609272 RepID=A0A5N8VDT0_9ACTN|nr:hypothetical protein [Streptomyces adustus]MPY33381.1 hypothetical protein [Streptomyces adustus]